MKKYWQALIALALATFLIITVPTLARSQLQDTLNSDLEGVELEQVEGVPVVIDGNSLFVIPDSFQGRSPEQRAQKIAEQVETLARDPSIPVESLQVGELGGTIVIFSGNTIIARVSEAGAKAANTTPRELSYIYLEKIQEFVSEYREKYALDGDRPGISISTNQWFQKTWEKISSLTMDENQLSSRKAITYTFILTFLLISLLVSINILSKKIYNVIEYQILRKKTDIKLKGLTLLTAEQITQIIIAILKQSFKLIKLLLVVIYSALILSFSPWGRKLGSNIIDYLNSGFSNLVQTGIDYIPNLFVIWFIVFVSSNLLRFLKFIFSEIGKERISFSGFYPEWAEPTAKIVEVGIIALSLVMAAPYLPGFGSPAFQGVSLFMGVLFSLGSSAAVSNAVAGIILIYTRAFQIGDRIEIEDTQGDVVEKSLLVTRLLTDDNVIVTLPNSNLLSSNILNYNAPIRDHNIPVALTINVNFAYDVPWKTVYEVVQAASENTPYILQDPPAKVLHSELGEFSVKYEIETYTNQPSKQEDILSELQKHLRDSCNASGIEILSPHYSAIRDGNESTVSENSLPKTAKNRGFTINSLGNLFQIDMQWGGTNQTENNHRSSPQSTNGQSRDKNAQEQS